MVQGPAIEACHQGGTRREQGLLFTRLRGLMTIAPWGSDPEQARPHFVSCRMLLEAIQMRFPEQGLTELSMGMSDDFEVAIEEGATLVRVGRALFGERHSKL